MCSFTQLTTNLKNKCPKTSCLFQLLLTGEQIKAYFATYLPAVCLQLKYFSYAETKQYTCMSSFCYKQLLWENKLISNPCLQNAWLTKLCPGYFFTMLFNVKDPEDCPFLANTFQWIRYQILGQCNFCHSSYMTNVDSWVQIDIKVTLDFSLLNLPATHWLSTVYVLVIKILC